jgi:hypothetical protein
MSSQIPPDPYFSGINFNPSFFTSLTDYLTVAIANSKYLRLIGGILSGNLGIKRTPVVELDVNGKVYIDNNSTSNPANGTLGSNGTRLILLSGSPTETPYSLGIGTNTLWYATGSTGSHNFYTGTTNIATFLNTSFETLILKSPTNINYQLLLAPPNATSGGAIQTILQGSGYNQDFLLQPVGGNVGIGTTDAQTKLDVRGKINIEIPAAATGNPENGIYGGNGTRLTLYPGSASTLAYSLGVAGSRLWYAGPSDVSHAFYAGTTERMKIDSIGGITCTGNIYMGTDNSYPNILLGSTEGNNIGIATAAGGFSTSALVNDMVIRSRYRLILQSGVDKAAIIIGTNSIGNIEYIAKTATGKHIFYINGTSTLVDWDVDDCTFFNSITTNGANFYTDGEYLLNTTKTNTGGTSKTGYFLSLEWFYNSSINIAFSHNDSTYTYWHGHIGTNNSTAPIYTTALAQSNATIENFQEQTTNKYWIYFRPTSAYNASVQLRVKLFG